MEHYWVCAKVKVGEKGYTDFWEREWRQHGTCSGLEQYDYFNHALDCALETPTIIRDNKGGSESGFGLCIWWIKYGGNYI